MAQTDVPMTASGMKRLQEELDDFITVKRPALSARIKAAREHGDLKENAEYHDAKNDQSFMETRIQQIEFQLRNAVVITDVDTSAVAIGTAVVVWDVDEAEELTYTVTGPTEADPLEMKVSAESPIGMALMGKSVGEIAQITLPRGSMQLEIRAIRSAT